MALLYMAQNGYCLPDIYLLAGINYFYLTRSPMWAFCWLWLVAGSLFQMQIHTKLLAVANTLWNNCPSTVQAESTDNRVPSNSDRSDWIPCASLSPSFVRWEVAHFLDLLLLMACSVFTQTILVGLLKKLEFHFYHFLDKFHTPRFPTNLMFLERTVDIFLDSLNY